MFHIYVQQNDISHVLAAVPNPHTLDLFSPHYYTGSMFLHHLDENLDELLMSFGERDGRYMPVIRDGLLHINIESALDITFGGPEHLFSLRGYDVQAIYQMALFLGTYRLMQDAILPQRPVHVHGGYEEEVNTTYLIVGSPMLLECKALMEKGPLSGEFVQIRAMPYSFN